MNTSNTKESEAVNGWTVVLVLLITGPIFFFAIKSEMDKTDLIKSTTVEKVATVVYYSPGKGGYVRVRLENEGVFKRKSANINGQKPKLGQQFWVKYDENCNSNLISCVSLSDPIDNYYLLNGVPFLEEKGEVLKWIKSSDYPDSRVVYEYQFKGKLYQKSQIVPRHITETLSERIIGKTFHVRIWKNHLNRSYIDLNREME